MKKEYVKPELNLIKPELNLIKPEDFETVMNNSRLREDDVPQNNHECCSLCNDHWHCEHPIDSWTGEAFNDGCDFYN